MKLVRKRVARPSAPIPAWATALNHEVRNYSMKGQAVVIISLFFLPGALVGEFLCPFGETNKVRYGLRRFIFEQVNDDVALRSFKNGIRPCGSRHEISLSDSTYRTRGSGNHASLTRRRTIKTAALPMEPSARKVPQREPQPALTPQLA